MNTLRWSAICPTGESVHLASVKLTATTAPDLHRHDFYECFLVESGRGRHRTGRGESPLTRGSLYFVRPEHGHGFKGSARHPLVFTNVAFECSVAESIVSGNAGLQQAWRPDGYPMAIPLSHHQRERFLAMVEDVSLSPRDRADAVFFLAGLGRLLRPVAQSTPDAGLPEWMREALPRACEPEHLLAGRSALVALCGRSHEHVSRSFRKYLSLSPTEWLTQERLRYACRLLETTQRSITDVAMDCGFESQSYFHQRFKAARGMTPLQFRRKASGVQSAENRARPRRPSQDEREPC